MSTFVFEALDEAGKTRKGSIEAGTTEEAIQRVRAQGLFPTSMKEQRSARKEAAQEKRAAAGQTGAGRKKRGGSALAIGGVNPKQLTLFTRQLSTLQDAGLPLLRSLQILEDQAKPGLMKSIIGGLVEEVSGGSSLSDSMTRFPKAFDRLYCKMVAAGEVGGVLDIILQRLAEFMEKSQRLKRRINGALVYPIVVISIAVLILTFIMVFIIPKFEAIFADFGVELPALTQWLVTSSRWVAGNAPGMFPAQGAVMIVGVMLATPVVFKLIRKTKPGRIVFDVLFLWTPVFGNLIRKTTIARFTRTLGTLIGAGVPILEAVTITGETSGNYVFERALGKVHDSIREGESFAEPLRASKTCDPIVVNMIAVGEETGEMDNMLMKIADNYEEEVDVAVASLVSLLEPLMVVVLAGIVGTIVVAMFMPLVSMIDGLTGGGGAI